MILDGHIHIGEGAPEPKHLIERMRAAGVDGGVLLSLPPSCFDWLGHPLTAAERLDNLFAWVEGHANLYPVFWIDPLEPDAMEQVALAHRRGVRAFKVICNRFYPRDPRALEVFQAIARTGKPILFHSGILWDGADSSRYNRPAEFEALLEVEGLKFSLAHISWPWCDEHIAVYGKIRQAYSVRPNLSVEMFVDLTPGTPPIYRQEALTKLFTVGYEVEDNIFFGSDCHAENYATDWTREWIERDNGIYRQLGLKPETIEKIHSRNLMRFLAIT
ncbi:MAG: hypothetical protein NTX50_27235 [Candidatus Sumerlaeota bacterium]|nr:hypothetical protein [Candidatus Sumerlaeota bacterium]